MLGGLIVLFFHFIAAPFAVVHALLFKRDHRAALGWISVSILFPIAGPLLYFFFGVNRIHHSAREVTGWKSTLPYFGYERGEVFLPQEPPPKIDNHPLAHVGWRTTVTPLTGGNNVTFLENGDAFYPRLIEAIKSAQARVWISSYIFSGSGVGMEIASALAEAVKRGVDTRVLVDGVGAWYSLHSLRRRLQDTGVRYVEFLPLRLLPPSLHINLRNHRKIAVIDTGYAFFGGLNIDDRHFVAAPRIDNPHKDVHFELYGPAAISLAEVFARDWYAATREVLTVTGKGEEQGNVRARVIEDGPDEGLDRLAMTLMGVVGGARRRIRIMTPYFLPHRELIGALQGAAVRGVMVEVLLPQRSNLRYVDWATRHSLWELLQWGVRVGLKPPPFAHSKIFMVDDDYVLAGSANLDPRSLRLNFEVGVELFDATLAATVSDYLDKAWKDAQILRLEDLDQRSIPVRLRDGFFWLFSAYL
ncbi:phospholipase D/Transphosphatidylase [Nitrosococcus halophilus Nc 4]|uniref:Phospholipase D/Transphosphatidylase n=1 Tax=Nitrosococcus halophilus (strain Nc4) TaxID=472759 RepID=D5C3Q0_NITHN|nr:phospholipase D-like domain-containing protein [Nitrosococcus halophilus]ADE15022.1 phospholipase D/Transphosphatidylase [Nitrosococcus halophilus Nc 4]